jgi:hypothetical protein
LIPSSLASAEARISSIQPACVRDLSPSRAARHSKPSNTWRPRSALS